MCNVDAMFTRENVDFMAIYRGSMMMAEIAKSSSCFVGILYLLINLHFLTSCEYLASSTKSKTSSKK
jgi:hypothetical protein